MARLRATILFRKAKSVTPLVIMLGAWWFTALAFVRTTAAPDTLLIPLLPAGSFVAGATSRSLKDGTELHRLAVFAAGITVGIGISILVIMLDPNVAIERVYDGVMPL